MIKKVTALLIASVMVLGLAACGNNNNTSEENKVSSSDNTNASTKQTQQSNQTEDISSETETDTEAETNTETGNSVVVYFSATGNTKAVAETLAAMQGTDLYEIVPEEPYTDEDLDYSNRSHRATAEQDDPNARPAISGGIDNIADYNVIYVGYPKMEQGYICV